jgi:hypothetical protein
LVDVGFEREEGLRGLKRRDDGRRAPLSRERGAGVLQRRLRK